LVGDNVGADEDGVVGSGHGAFVGGKVGRNRRILGRRQRSCESEGRVHGFREVVKAAKLMLVASGVRRTNRALCNDQL
jgi:hypothetical protein